MAGLKEDKRPYDEKRAVLGNLGLLLWLLLGTVAVWFYYPLGAWFFLFFALFAVFGVVRKKLCKTLCLLQSLYTGLG